MNAQAELRTVPTAPHFCKHWRRTAGAITGLGALAWFLVRVIPKPSRATYPCPRAALPIAGGFVVWLAVSLTGVLAAVRMRQLVRRYGMLATAAIAVTVFASAFWATRPASSPAAPAAAYRFAPEERNVPKGIAGGVNPGRVVWAHDPSAAKWSGQIKSATNPWWSNESTDQASPGVWAYARRTKENI